MSVWDDFTKDVEQLSLNHRVPTCGVQRFLDELNWENRLQVEAALNRRDITATGLEKALRKRVPNAPSSYTIGRHRRGACCCAEEGNTDD